MTKMSKSDLSNREVLEILMQALEDFRKDLTEEIASVGRSLKEDCRIMRDG